MTGSPRERRPGRARGAAALGAVLLCLVVFAPTSSALVPRAAQSVKPPFGISLNSRMSALFHALSLNSLPLAERLFFPESAYVAMKTGRIPAPASDYASRLIAFYRLDLGAYHAVMFTRGTAAFIGVNVNATDANWIAPGVCENSIGYWHVPDVRLVYRVKGIERSVAVASLISWRGVWYVVHLGPNPRPQNVGTVDAPALGRGVAGGPWSC